MQLTPELLEVMCQIGHERYPNEACGVVTERGKVIELQNISSDPTRSYIVDADEVREKLDTDLGVGEEFIIWHTHPSGLVGPSKGDLECRVEGLRYGVVAIPTGEWKEF